MTPHFEYVMLDPLGLLLLPAQYYGSTTSSIPPKLMRRMLLSGIWQRYERGQIPSLEEAATALAQLPFVKASMGNNITSSAIATCLSHHRSHSLRELPDVAKLLDNLREQHNLKLVCATNATREEIWMLQRRLPTAFARFDTIVFSGEEGVGKTSQHFMQVALQKAGIRHAHYCMYLDASDMQSVIAARSVGMHAALIQPHQLIARIFNPSARHINLQDLASLETLISPLPQPNTTTRNLPIRGAYQFPSLTSEGVRIWDNFGQFLIADALNDPRFLPMQSIPDSGLICFINKAKSSVGKSGTMGLAYHIEVTLGGASLASRMPTSMDASTFKDIPDDLDTTSIGLSVLYKFRKVSMETIHKVLDKMLEHVSRDDGVLQVYFDSERPRIDPVVVANAVYLFHLANRGKEVEASERFVQSVLLHRAYEHRTLYYNVGEAFLLHVARLVDGFKEHFTRSGMRGLLVARLQQHRAAARWGEDALALAMCMRACRLSGLQEASERERQALLGLRREDRWWDCHAYYRYGGNLQSWIGNEALTTAYSLLALA